MSKYDKFAEHKIDKLIRESAQNRLLLVPNQHLHRPKATAVGRAQGQLQVMTAMQGE